MNKIFYSLMILVFFSCQDFNADIELPINTIIEVDSTLIWKIPKTRDTIETGTTEPLIFEDKIIFTNKYFGINKNEEVVAVNSFGEQVWTWSDFINENKVQQINVDWKILNDKLVFSSWKDNYCLNLNSGMEKWRFIYPYGDPRISVGLEDLVIKPISYSESSPRSDSTSIMIADIEQGEFQEVFKIRKSGNHEVSIPNVVAYLNHIGDTILVFQCNNLRISPYEEVIDLYSFNLTQKEILWSHKGLSDLSWNVHEPIVDENHIYFATKYSVFCFEKESGNLIWSKKLYHDFQGSNYLIYNDLFITNLDNGDLIAISKHNGETVWVKQGLGACCTELRIYDDKLYMGNGDLFIIQAETGEVLFRYTSPTKKEKGRSNAYFLNAIAVDLENQRMYATDSYYLLCLKLPEF